MSEYVTTIDDGFGNDVDVFVPNDYSLCEDGGNSTSHQSNSDGFRFPPGHDCVNCGIRCCADSSCTSASLSDTSCACYGLDSTYNVFLPPSPPPPTPA